MVRRRDLIRNKYNNNNSSKGSISNNNPHNQPVTLDNSPLQNQQDMLQLKKSKSKVPSKVCMVI
jgi:hypothetical protein